MSIYDIEGRELSANVFPLGLHTAPQNQGVLNAIKRARQLTDVKWTPAVDIPRWNRFVDNDGSSSTYRDKFLAGVEYTGIPYTSAKGPKVQRYGYTRVVTGCFTGIDTFVTSAANKDSFFCKESEFDGPIVLASMYGSTCCGLVSYVLNIPWINTEDFGDLITDGRLISKGLVSQSNSYELADVLLNTSRHVAIITDIVRDGAGNITFIEVSENTTAGAYNPSEVGGQFGGVARRMGWSFNDFCEYFATFTLCRYRDIGNIPYTPSNYVNVGDELNMIPPANFPCLPYMGENFAYKYGYVYNSDILIATDYFSELDVYKDGTLFNTFEVASGTEKITVGFSAKGSYEAFLCIKSNGAITQRSKSCHWTVT